MTSTKLMSRLSVWLDPHPALDGMALIDHLFNRLDGLYPNRWRAAFAGQQAIDNWREAWAEGFCHEALTLEDVRVGLHACRTRFSWPPSFAEFVSACRPNLEPEAAHAEAVRQLRLRGYGRDEWSHPAIFWAAMSVGEHDLRSSSWLMIRERWTNALRKEIARRNWEPVPRAALMLSCESAQKKPKEPMPPGWLMKKVREMAQQKKGECHELPC